MTNPLLSLTAWLARTLPLEVKRSFYRIKPLATLIRSGLNRAAPLGSTQVIVAAGELAGMALSLDLQSEKDYWLGTYEVDLQAAVADLVEPGMVAYDVGANIGYVSLLLARRVGETGRVFAFEALPANLERLHANLALNDLASRVQVVPVAVVDGDGVVRFRVGPSGGMGKADGSAGRQEVSYQRTINVEGISLDAFVYQHEHPPPAVIKMDIEGGEVLALPGMVRLLVEARPLVLLELHGPQAASRAWGTLMDAGYKICRMSPGYPGVPSLETLEWKSYVVAFPMG
jgi:FkbM family methyltransferase